MLRQPVASLTAWVTQVAAAALGRAVAAAAAYGLAAVLAAALAGPDAAATGRLGLPAGVALALLLRWGIGMAPGIAMGAFAVALWEGSPVLPAAWLAFSASAAPALAGHWLRRRGLRASMQRRRDLALFALGAAATALLGTFGAALAWLASGQLAAASAPAWWLGAALRDAAGIALLTLPLIGASQPSLLRAVGLRGARLWLLLALLGGTALLFSRAPAGALVPWLVVPPLMLCLLAVRAGAFEASLWALAVALLAAVPTANGLGPFGNAADALPAYLGGTAALALLVAVLAAEVTANEQRWSVALAGSPIGVAEFDRRSGDVVYSTRWIELLGASPLGEGNPALYWVRRSHLDDAAAFRRAIAGVDDPTLGEQRLELRLRDATDDWHWFELRLQVVERSRRGRALRIVATMQDIERRRGTEQRQRLAASLLANLHEGMLVTDAQYRALDVNAAYSAITGTARENVLGTVPSLLQPAGAPAGLWAGLRAVGSWSGDIVQRRPNGDPCTWRVTVSAVRDASGAPLHLVLVLSDMTEQLLHREALEREKQFDELTRLPNRARLTRLLAEAREASGREGWMLVVCHLDLDRFKAVNERYGRTGGDRVLVDLAGRLRGALRSGAHWADSVARIGGDEFVLLLRARALDEAAQAVERVLGLVTQPFDVGPGHAPAELTASIGATVFPADHADPETLLRHADHAMYGAKQAGRNGCLFFDPELSRRTEARVVAVGRVQEALDRGELELYYQPKVDLRDGRLLGAEALLRWNHPEFGVMPPAQFLPLVEHTSLSADLGAWVLERAVEQMARWRADGLDLSISVNVSARHLQAADFVDRLQALLTTDRRGQPAYTGTLELEVLETAALADLQRSRELMERCRALGVRFALDDFGTGYTNLAYLKQLPIDVLKLDRSFVHHLLTDVDDLAIVENVIGLARTFDCDLIAEGVESAEQARRLVELGCVVGQGTGIAAPMPAPELVRWARGARTGFAV